MEISVDHRDLTGSAKSWDWIKRGVPLRAEIGPRDLANQSVFLGRRDKGAKEKQSIPMNQLVTEIGNLLDSIQTGLYEKALAYREANTKKIDSKEEFYAYFTPKNQDKPEIHGGFASTHWCGSAAVEEQIKNELKVTIRCVPIESTSEPGVCPFTGQPSKQRVIFAKAY